MSTIYTAACRQMSHKYTLLGVQPERFPLFQVSNSLFVLTHSVLWSFMELEIEGKNGWMFSTPTKCSGIFGFTNYHMVMNYIILLTLLFALKPKMKTEDLCVFVLYWNIWFILEDTLWFFVNNITYSTAPWQTHTTKVLCIGLMGVNFIILFFIAGTNVSKLHITLISCVQLAIVMFVGNPSFGSSFKKEFSTLQPRQSYC